MILFFVACYVDYDSTCVHDEREVGDDESLGDLSPGLTGSVVGPTAAVLLARKVPGTGTCPGARHEA